MGNHYKRETCIDCGKPTIYPGRCRDCYNKERQDHPPPQHLCPDCGTLISHASTRCSACNKEHLKRKFVNKSLLKKRAQGTCTQGPAHHWFLDEHNFGVCKVCGATKQFRPEYA